MHCTHHKWQRRAMKHIIRARRPRNTNWAELLQITGLYIYTHNAGCPPRARGTASQGGCQSAVKANLVLLAALHIDREAVRLCRLLWRGSVAEADKRAFARRDALCADAVDPFPARSEVGNGCLDAALAWLEPAHTGLYNVTAGARQRKVDVLALLSAVNSRVATVAAAHATVL